MTTQLEIEGIAPPTLTTPTGKMKCTSLRPGDWLASHDEHTPWSENYLVTVNSNRLRITVLRWDHHENPHQHAYLMARGFRYIGHGAKRRWHELLPAWLQKRINPYSKP